MRESRGNAKEYQWDTDSELKPEAPYWDELIDAKRRSDDENDVHVHVNNERLGIGMENYLKSPEGCLFKTWLSSGADASGRYGTKTGAMGAVPAVGESFGGLVAGARVVLWLWLGAGFRGGGGALGAGGEYDVNGCVTNGLKFAPLREIGETMGKTQGKQARRETTTRRHVKIQTRRQILVKIGMQKRRDFRGVFSWVLPMFIRRGKSQVASLRAAKRNVMGAILSGLDHAKISPQLASKTTDSRNVAFSPPYRKRRRRKPTYAGRGRGQRYLPGMRWGMHLCQQTPPSSHYFYYQSQRQQQQQQYSCVSIASSSTASPVMTPKLPSLKIRLTIPPSMLGKRRASFSKSKNVPPTTSAFAAGGGTYTVPSRPSTSFSSQYGSAPKRRGRPPKSTPSSRKLGIKSNNDALSFYHPSQAAHRRKPSSPKKSGTPRIPAKLKGKGTTVKKSSAAKRRRVEYSESSSELSDVDDHFHFNQDNDDARSVQFPTFVSASALSSSSDSDNVSLSGFDTDSSMEAEEENFIVTEESRAAEKSRVRRELLGEDSQKRRNPHNNWIIRPRKRSVGPSDAEMEIDSDATEEDDDEEEEQEAEEDDEADDLPVGSGYIGVATGWSEEDESRALTLTDDDHSCTPDENDERGDDGDQSDLDSMSLSDAALAGLIPRLRRDLEHLPFELTEGWDGQVFFSNDGEFDNGDTTDEELVGEDQLPNERAMRMFHLPFSVSSINPMSTMSPSGSPAPRHRRPFGSQGTLDSPKPADILSGRVFLEDSDHADEFDVDDDNALSVSSSRGNGPRTGSFIPCDTIRAVIDDTHASIPSPHPRVRARRGKSASHFGRTSPRHSLLRQLSLPPVSQPSFQLLSSSELTTSPELPAQAIDLDDVLDSAFLDSEPSDGQSRWGWGSDTPGPSADFENALRNSPLSGMLWQQDKDSSRQPQSGAPFRARDGDRTPTNAMVNNQPPPQHDVPTKSRKESRRERKVKQKN
ncbi:hypothetical protein B0H13DRAFT_1869099 [Mycena leptocephala]|nr:hypothetical protein B0H13DRAFT_1869099 [Mycena leptocephala]